MSLRAALLASRPVSAYSTMADVSPVGRINL